MFEELSEHDQFMVLACQEVADNLLDVVKSIYHSVPMHIIPYDHLSRFPNTLSGLLVCEKQINELMQREKKYRDSNKTEDVQ